MSRPSNNSLKVWLPLFFLFAFFEVFAQTAKEKTQKNDPVIVIQQTSHGDNSPNIVNHINRKYTLQELRPDIESVIRELRATKDRSLRKIAGAMERGNTADALYQIQIALTEFKNDADTLALVHYAASQNMYLTQLYSAAAAEAFLASSLAPANCRYRATSALLKVTIGKPNEAYSAVDPSDLLIQKCLVKNSTIEAALIYLVRAIYFANIRDENMTKVEFDAMDSVLDRLQQSKSKTDNFYVLELNCRFAQITKQWWINAENLWPKAVTRCVEWGRKLNKTSQGAEVLSECCGNYFYKMMDLKKNPDPIKLVSEQISQWSRTPAIPELGVDEVQRLTVLGGLFVQRGFLELWTMKNVARAETDYSTAFSLLRRPAESLRPSAINEFAQLGLKINHLEQLSKHKFDSFYNDHFRNWIKTVSSSNISGSAYDVCQALGATTTLSVKINAGNLDALDRKRSVCTYTLQRGSFYELNFRLAEAERYTKPLSRIGPFDDNQNDLSRLIDIRTEMLGFPYVESNATALAELYNLRSYFYIWNNSMDLAYKDAEHAREISESYRLRKNIADSLEMQAWILGVEKGMHENAQRIIEKAKILRREEYEDPRNLKFSCLHLFQYVSTLQVEAQIETAVKNWKSAAQVVDILLAKISEKDRCGDINFDVDADREHFSDVKSLLSIALVDANQARSLLSRLGDDEIQEMNLSQSRQLKDLTVDLKKAYRYLLPLTYQIENTLTK